VIVDLKNAPPVVFDERRSPNGNYIRLRLSPDVAIGLGARAKKPGQAMEGIPVELSIIEQPEQGSGGRMEPYERLLGDAMRGDATLFARQDVVEAAWAIVDPILHESTELHEYECGSSGPAAAETLVRGVGGWRCGE
jgi:glucose-6-phosphate 1-dehydrogenase